MNPNFLDFEQPIAELEAKIVELRANAQAPLFRLPVIEPLEAFYWRADFTLVAGEVIHDYLAG